MNVEWVTALSWEISYNPIWLEIALLLFVAKHQKKGIRFQQHFGIRIFLLENEHCNPEKLKRF